MSFSDVVGQEELKEALLAVAANDDLDGLLVRGEKGTAKSTAVRALTALLPAQEAVADCPYGCPPDPSGCQCEACRERTDPPTAERPVPLVTLPLGATRERVVGTLSVADALGGDYQFDPGLLARANRGILYVDEVNLLDDHLVDVLLDAAASGVNRVERDGVSVSHPAEFTLVGTMNPEEGDLRPQLRDRFALQATVTACNDVDRRVEIIDLAIGRGGGDSEGDTEDRRARTAELRDRLGRARERLGDVALPRAFAEEIAELCRDAGVEGHRGDIATARAARTFAALDGRPKVVEPDVRRAAELALPHRLRSRPFEDAPDPGDLIDEHFDGDEGDAGEGDGEEGHGEESDDADESESPTGDEGGESDEIEEGPTSEGSAGGGESDVGEGDGAPDETDDGDGHAPAEAPQSPDGADGSDGRGGGAGPSRRDDGGRDDREANAPDGDESGGDEQDGDERTEGAPLLPGQNRDGVGDGRAPELSVPDAVGEGTTGGSRSSTDSRVDADGPRVRTRRADSNRGIDAAASVRAAAGRGAESVGSRDLRQSVRRGESSALVLFVVDASASMRPAMRAAKGTVLELLKDAYRQRDEVGFVAFAGDGADVLLPPTDSVTLAARHLKDLPTGDRTPLPAGLRTAGEVLGRADPAASVVVLVTDGRANVADGSPVGETRKAARGLSELGAHVVVVDAGDDRPGLAGLVAEETGGERVPLAALSAAAVDARVGAARERASAPRKSRR